MTGYTLRMEFEVYHLTLQDYQISSVNAISTVLTSHWEIPAAHDGKRMGYSWEKLDLSDETIVGVGQMRTTTDIVPQ